MESLDFNNPSEPSNKEMSSCCPTYSVIEAITTWPPLWKDKIKRM